MKTPLLKLPQTAAQQSLWFGVFIAAAICGSFAFSCATPFSALAALAALMLPRKSNIIFMLSAWAVNQFVGFAFLGYPQDASTLAWALIMGISAVSAGLLASVVVGKLRATVGDAALMGAALLAGFVGFQAVLLVANLTPLGSLDTFAFAIKAKIFMINVVAFLGLWAMTYVAARSKLLNSHQQWA